MGETNYGEWDAIISMYKNDVINIPSNPEVWNCHAKSWTIAIAGQKEDGTLYDGTFAIIRGDQGTDFDISKSDNQKQGVALMTTTSNIGFRPVMYVKVPERGSRPYVLIEYLRDVYGMSSMWE